MSFNFDTSKELNKTLDKLAKKDKALALAVRKKIRQIIFLDEQSIEHFKNLKGDLSHLKRVHIGSFVLEFKIKGDKITFEKLRHHDKAYKN